MDFDLLSEYIDGSDAPSADQLLSNLQDRQTLTHQQPDQTSSPSDDGSDDGRGQDQDTDIRLLDRNQAGAVITKIEDIFESMASCILQEGKELVIPLKSRPRKQKTANEAGSPRNYRQPKTETKNITFPSKSPKEAWKFSMWMSNARSTWLMKV